MAGTNGYVPSLEAGDARLHICRLPHPVMSMQQVYWYAGLDVGTCFRAAASQFGYLPAAAIARQLRRRRCPMVPSCAADDAFPLRYRASSLLAMQLPGSWRVPVPTPLLQKCSSQISEGRDPAGQLAIRLQRLVDCGEPPFQSLPITFCKARQSTLQRLTSHA